MDRRERMDSLLVTIQAALQGFQADVWTAMPAYVAGTGFNAEQMTVQAQPTIQAQVRAPTGQSWINTNLPLCLDCPVVFPGGGGMLLTFPIALGDEGILIFASRCIDAWWQSGGIQPQAELRMHDLSDGFFIPKCFSKPNIPSSVSTSTAQLRSLDGTTYVEIAGGQIVNIVAPNGCKITANVEITGTLKVDGATTATTITASGLIKGQGVEDTVNNVTLNNHTHSGVQSGSGTSGPPTPGS